MQNIHLLASITIQNGLAEMVTSHVRVLSGFPRLPESSLISSIQTSGPFLFVELFTHFFVVYTCLYTDGISRSIIHNPT